MSRDNGQAMTEKPGRWWGMLSAFVDQRLSTLSPLTVCVWLVLFRNNRGGIVQIGQDLIAATLGVERGAVTRQIGKLVDAGLICVEVQGRRQYGASRYRMLMVSTPVTARHETRPVYPAGHTENPSVYPGSNTEKHSQCISRDTPQCIARDTPLHKREQDGDRSADACASRSDIDGQSSGEKT